jgi:hypothetical protein
VGYQLTVTDTAGRVETSAIGTFVELSAAIDKAMAAPGFVRYAVGTAGDRAYLTRTVPYSMN